MADRTLLPFDASSFPDVGVVLIHFLVHEYHVSFGQALLGTWRWKRVLRHLDAHHHHDDDDNKQNEDNDDDDDENARSMHNVHQRERLLRLFDRLDADRSGVISPDELLDAVRRAGYRITVRDVKLMIRAADADENGVISRDEWHDLVVDDIVGRRSSL